MRVLVSGDGSRLRNLNKKGSKDSLEVQDGKKVHRSCSKVLAVMEMGRGGMYQSPPSMRWSFSYSVAVYG